MIALARSGSIFALYKTHTEKPKEDRIYKWYKGSSGKPEEEDRAEDHMALHSRHAAEAPVGLCAALP